MGGMLYSTAEGFLYGIIAGLENSEHISTHVMHKGIDKIEIPSFYTKPVQVEYYIGYGSGYEQGQKLRLLLKNDLTNQMSLDEKVKCLSFLLRKQRLCRQNLTQSFVDNIKYWEFDQVSAEIISELQNLLQQNKIQMAIDKLFLYYKNNYYLKPLMEFYEIYKKLKDVRQEKKKNKNYIITKDLEKIKTEIQTWISLK